MPLGIDCPQKKGGQLNLHEAVLRAAQLLENLLGENANLDIRVDPTGAIIHIPRTKEDTNNASAQAAAESPVAIPAVEPESAESADDTGDDQSTVGLSQAATAPTPREKKTVALSTEQLQVEQDRLMGIAGEISGEEERTIDLVPWLVGNQVRQLITGLWSAGYYVKPWRRPAQKGKQRRFRYTYDGGVRIFVGKMAQRPPAETPAAVEIPPEQEDPVGVAAPDPR